MTPDNSFSTVRSDPTRLGDLARYFITYFPLEWFTAAARLKGMQDVSNLCIATLARVDYRPSDEFQKFLGYGAGNSTLHNPRGASRLILEASVDVIDDITNRVETTTLPGALSQDQVRVYMTGSMYSKIKEAPLQKKALEELPIVLEKLADADRIKEAAEKVERERQEKINTERRAKEAKERKTRDIPTWTNSDSPDAWGAMIGTTLKTDPALIKKLKSAADLMDGWKNTGVIIPEDIDEEIKFEEIEVDDTGLTKATAGAAKLKKQQEEQALARKVAAAKRELEQVVAAAKEKERLRVADLPSDLAEGSETVVAGSW